MATKRPRGLPIPGGRAPKFVPDNRTRIARATRFFARIERVIIECPRCGKIYRLNAYSRKEHNPYNPMTGRFHCVKKTCDNRWYILGVLAWPIHRATHVASQPPMDQVPDIRQLPELRREGGGWWLAQEAAITLKRPQETNINLEEDRNAPDDPENEEDQ